MSDRVKKVAAVIGLLVIGAVVALAIAHVIRLHDTRARELDLEELRRKFVQEHTLREQARLGIQCATLRQDLKRFLESDFQPILVNKEPDPQVFERLDGPLEHYSKALFTCGLLYYQGKQGTLNGLEDLDFAQGVERDFITLRTMTRHGLKSKECDDRCREQMHGIIREAYRKIISAL